MSEVKKSSRKSLPSAIPQPEIEPRGLTLRAACAYAGVSLWFLRTAIWEGKLPSVRAGRRIVVLKDSLDQFLKEQEQKSGARP